MSATEHFLDAARRYCNLIESVEGLTKDDLLVALQRLLPEVYRTVVVLDPTFTDTEEPEGMSTQDWQRIYDMLVATLGEDPFWQVGDPWEKDADVSEGLLAYNLADIYRELGNVIDDPRGEEGAWDWRFAFDTHWGEHLTNALNAIHWLRPSSV